MRHELASIVLGDIVDQMEDARIGEIDLASRIGRKPAYVRNLLEEPSMMSLADLADVMFALGCKVHALGLDTVHSPMKSAADDIAT